MEHRCAERIVGELKILIHKHNYPVAIGRVKNGSRTGVFVETDFADLECEQQIRLELSLNKTGVAKSQSFLIEALIIHKTERGFGAAIDLESSTLADFFISALTPKIRKEETHLLALAI